MEVDVVEEEAVVETDSFIQMGEPTSPGSSHLKYARVKASFLFSHFFFHLFATHMYSFS